MIHEFPIFDIDKPSRTGKVYSKKLLTKLRKDVKAKFNSNKPYYATITDLSKYDMGDVPIGDIIGPITNAKLSKGEFVIEITIDGKFQMGTPFEKMILDLNELEYGFSPVGFGTFDQNNNINNDYTFIMANFIRKDPLQNIK